jgi:hypothetical protein
LLEDARESLRQFSPRHDGSKDPSLPSGAPSQVEIGAARDLRPAYSALVTEAKPQRRHLNAVEKRALQAADARLFVQQYGRKAQKGVEPNDRRFDEDYAKAVRRMKPERLDQLLRDDEEGS